jgi:hypothetical protein
MVEKMNRIAFTRFAEELFESVRAECPASFSLE